MRRFIVSVAALALFFPLMPAASGQPAPHITYTYDIQTRGDVTADMEHFANVADVTFSDPRGWTLGRSIRFVRDEGGDTSFTLWMADPSEMESFSSTCSAQYSCRVGDDVIINEERWEDGASPWPLDLHEYRHYVLIHELGHWMGLDHASCPGAGEPAPTMMQESKGTDGCIARVWPLPGERQRAAELKGVPVRFDDGFGDLQWYESWKDGSVTVGLSTGDRFDHAGAWVSGYGEPALAFTEDVNGDGMVDLLWYEPWKDDGITVALSTGDRFVQVGQWITGLPVPDFSGLADVDNDGMSDLVWYTAEGGAVQVALSRGDTFGPLETWIDGFGDPDWADLGDVDRDGDADLFWYEAWNDGSVTMALSERDRFVHDGAWLDGFGEPDVASAGDVNGDNRADLLWYEAWKDGSITVALSEPGRFDYAGAWLSGWGTPDKNGFDDLNGDARVDVLWYESWKDGSVTAGLSRGDRFSNDGPWISGYGTPDKALWGAAD